MKKVGLFIMGLIVASFGLISTTQAAQTPQTTDVFLTLSGGEVTIGSTGSIDLGTFNVSTSDQEAEGTFADNFWVEDLKGADEGWRTTLQTTDMIHQTDGTIKIPANNISIKAPTTLTVIAGTTNPLVVLDAAWANYRSFTAAGTPLTFISRDDNGANHGVLGKYGVKPSIKVTIPAYQAVGTYKAVLTYTLFEN